MTYLTFSGGQEEEKTLPPHFTRIFINVAHWLSAGQTVEADARAKGGCFSVQPCVNFLHSRTVSGTADHDDERLMLLLLVCASSNVTDLYHTHTVNTMSSSQTRQLSF